jgi:hypothetical protein
MTLFMDLVVGNNEDPPPRLGNSGGMGIPSRMNKRQHSSFF